MRLDDRLRLLLRRPYPRSPLEVRRLEGNPIIHPGLLDPGLGRNINGPSLIRTPNWLPGRLGRYYLYFASHRGGEFIRLAYADSLEGPWSIHAPGTLHLGDVPGTALYLSAPDVHVDEERREIRMYFHGGSIRDRAARSFLARSADGIRFAGEGEPLAPFYLRALPWRGEWLGMAKGGRMFRSPDGLSHFRETSRPAFRMRSETANRFGDVRHVALHLVGDVLHVFHTRIGDAPEQILVSTLDLDRPDWVAGPRHSVLSPEREWEGAGLPLTLARSGPSRAPERGLRDPAIHAENGRLYLLYAVAGEAGIAIAELIEG
jgi:hypothetical protein